MAKNTQLTSAMVNTQAGAIVTALQNGYLRIYSGTQPATADTALSGNTLLAELRFNATTAGVASGGVITFNGTTTASAASSSNPIGPNNAAASGTATFFRCLQSDGTTVVFDGTVDVSANTPNLALNSTALSSGAAVQINSFSHTVQKSTSGL